MIHHETQGYRREFVHVLEPFFDMLQHLKLQMNHQDWLRMVYRTESSIISNPDQYLGRDLPSLGIISKTIAEIFEGFLKEQVSMSEESVAHY